MLRLATPTGLGDPFVADAAQLVETAQKEVMLWLKFLGCCGEIIGHGIGAGFGGGGGCGGGGWCGGGRGAAV